MTTFLCHPARAAILECAKITGISHSRLYSTCKTRRVVHARWAVMIVLRRHGLSFQEIAAEFGMHHTSIIHGVCEGVALLPASPWLATLVSHLDKHLS